MREAERAQTASAAIGPGAGGEGRAALERALRQVVERRPGLSIVLSRYGEMRVGEYCQRVFHERSAAGSSAAREVLADAVVDEAAPLRRLPGYEDVLADARRCVRELGVLNTGPHHGVFGHPYLVADMILPTLSPHRSAWPIVVLADSAVPLDNMIYPPGLLLTERRREGGLYGQMTRVRLRLTPSKNDVCMVAARPHGEADVRRASSALAKLGREGALTPRKVELLQRILRAVCRHEAVLAASSYSEQVSLMNAMLFPALFGEELRADLPRLLYLDSARVFSRAVSGLLLRREEPVVARLVLDAQLRRAFVECTRASQVTKSTDLFFGVSPAGKRLPLRLSSDGEQLADERGEIRPVVLTRDALVEALNDGRIYAGFSLGFAALAGSGVDCIGGFNQAIGYLPQFLESYARFLSAHALEDEARQVEARDPFRLSTLGAVLVARGDEVERAGAFDIIAGGGGQGAVGAEGLSRDEIDRLRALRVSDWVTLNLPDLYLMTVPRDEKDPDLASALNAGAIARALGIDAVRLADP